MSELQLIYKFLADYPETGVIHADGVFFAVSACKNDKDGAMLLWHNGETISYAIHRLYEAIEEKEQGK